MYTVQCAYVDTVLLICRVVYAVVQKTKTPSVS